MPLGVYAVNWDVGLQEVDMNLQYSTTMFGMNVGSFVQVSAPVQDAPFAAQLTSGGSGLQASWGIGCGLKFRLHLLSEYPRHRTLISTSGAVAG